MKECKQCGHLNNDDAPFCGNCGASLEVIERTPVIICPNCGRTYTNPNIKRCLSCGHELISSSNTTCPHCGKENAPNARYCSLCGRPLQKDKATIRCIKCGSINDIDSDVCVVCGAPLYEKLEEEKAIIINRPTKKHHRKKAKGVLKKLVNLAILVIILVSFLLPCYSLTIDGRSKIFCIFDNTSYALRRIGINTLLYSSDRLYDFINPITEGVSVIDKYMAGIGWIFIVVTLIILYQIVRTIIMLFEIKTLKEENNTFIALAMIIGIISSLIFLFAYNAGQANFFGKIGDYLISASGHNTVIGLFHGAFVSAGICLIGYIASFIGSKK